MKLSKNLKKAIKAKLLQKWTSYNHRLHILNHFAVIIKDRTYKII